MFDTAIRIDLDGVGEMDLVVHRGPLGDPVCWHSPLNDGAVKCSIYEDGARVYIA